MSTDFESMIKQFISDHRRTPSAAATEIVPTMAAFGIGLLVGAGVALLFAPASGEEFREGLSEHLGDLKNRVVGSEETATEAVAES